MSVTEPPTSAVERKSSKWELVLALLLLGLVAVDYGQTLRFGFVNFDDDAHVYENPQVTTGVTPANLAWSFGIHGPSQWHPLAWLSHQIDCELFGLKPAGHHAVNVLLHALATLLLYQVCRALTCGPWAAAWIAAAFAVHPLNVESVAWIAERRNVLAAVFWMLTVLAYLSWVRQPKPGGYALLLAMHALALMSKPLAVTLPCVLLLLDVWPLGRATVSGVPSERGTPTADEEGGASHPSAPGGPQRAKLTSGAAEPGMPSRAWRQCVVEKLPLFVLSGGASWLSIECQRSIGTVSSLEAISMPIRLTNAVSAYGCYLYKTLVPWGLCVFYPHPALVEHDPWASILPAAVLSGLALLAISLYVWFQRQRSPWLLIGWLWFLGTLVPMIGIMQVGEQQQADRYAYLPLVGIFFAVGREAQRVARRSHGWQVLLGLLGLLAIGGWTFVARQQTRVWQNSETLFLHALEVDPWNHWACNNLALALQQKGQNNEAARYLRKAIEVKPTYELAHYNLGVVLVELNQPESALGEFRAAIYLNPAHVAAHSRMGTTLSQLGQLKEGVKRLEIAHELSPLAWETSHNLGVALAAGGQKPAAAEMLLKAHQIDPKNAATLMALIPLLRDLGRQAEAQKLFDEAAATDPQFHAAGDKLLGPPSGP